MTLYQMQHFVAVIFLLFHSTHSSFFFENLSDHSNGLIRVKDVCMCIHDCIYLLNPLGVNFLCSLFLFIIWLRGTWMTVFVHSNKNSNSSSDVFISIILFIFVVSGKCTHLCIKCNLMLKALSICKSAVQCWMTADMNDEKIYVLRVQYRTQICVHIFKNIKLYIIHNSV